MRAGRLDTQSTRDHGSTILKQHCMLTIRKRFFSQRVIEEWNCLPVKAVEAGNINVFNNCIDTVLRKRGGYL